MSEHVLSVDPAQQPAPASAANGNYDSSSVQVLRDFAHIRQRPGMYIGDTGPHGLHHLVYELVYNAVDEALAGHCTSIHVQCNVDGSLTVSDDGRGIPVEEHPDLKKPTLEVVLTTVGAGAKFDKRTYKTSAGLHGIGAKAVTALSEWVEARVRRNNRVYVQEYERGKAITPVKDLGAAHGTGTAITFKPDPEIFHDATFSRDTLETHLRELAFLNKGLAIRLTDERTHYDETFRYAGGIAEFVEYLNRSEDPLHKPIYIEKVQDDVKVEVALQWTTSDEQRVRCYTNNAYNPDGGVHLSGFRSALTRTLNAYGAKENLFKNNLTPTGEDFREGLTAVISVAVPEPQFAGQTKDKLNNPEVEGIVTSVVNERLSIFLEEHPKDAQRIMKKVILAAEAREAAAKAKKAVKDRKSILSGGGLPGKLLDCTSRDRDESELFLVEGDSAGGTAESGRDRRFQAILPLRGKPLNVEKARLEKVIGNEEICSIISAVGIDIENSDDIDKRRYGKIVILTDADVDGQHIRTLLLTFFYRQMRRLLEAGHVFVARPPLYKVTQKKHSRYVWTLEEMDAELVRRGLEGGRLRLEQLGSVLEGERLARLVEILARLERSLQILERRGLGLGRLLEAARDGALPTHRALLAGKELWFRGSEEVDQFLAARAREGKELVVVEESSPTAAASRPAAETNGQGQTISIKELHEVKDITECLRLLADFGLAAADVLPAPHVAGREPPVRFVLEQGDQKRILPHLRELGPEVRRLGERGLSITRFKGLGEMDDSELWETTLDPQRRTLLQVRLEDAQRADDMFRILMGEKVEPRREFIQKHALEVKDIDYHGA
jgi:DNA gyrase subunit B